MSEQSRISKIVQLWKEKNIDHALFTFCCGGDSMNDTEWEFFDAKGNELKGVDKIERYLNEEVYNKVTFYVDSNGHYQGEAGTVKVTLYETEGEEPRFSYSKSAESEYTESFVDTIEIELTPEQAEFIRNYVANINGGSDATVVINFKTDCLLSDEEEDILDELEETLDNAVDDAEPENEYEGELDGWFEFNTDLNNEESIPQFKEGKPNTLLVQKRFTATVFRSEDKD